MSPVRVGVRQNAEACRATCLDSVECLWQQLLPAPVMQWKHARKAKRVPDWREGFWFCLSCRETLFTMWGETNGQQRERREDGRGKKEWVSFSTAANTSEGGGFLLKHSCRSCKHAEGFTPINSTRTFTTYSCPAGPTVTPVRTAQ